MTGRWWEYLLVFGGSAILCLSLTPVAISVAIRIDHLDHPGGHKTQESPVPYLGGVALVISFAVAVLAAFFVVQPNSGGRELLLILGVAVGLAIVGLLDDLRQLSPTWRLLAEVGAAAAVWSIESGVEVSGVVPVDMVLTVLWVVGISNAFNLLDNMDGLSAGLGAIACTAFFAIAVANGQFLVAALAAGLAGCASGFLRSNFHPARIYMGDGGALFVGFLIAYLGIKLRFEAEAGVAILVPVLVCSIAIFDTTLVTVARLGARRSPFQGGRDHLSHRLVNIGLSVPVAVGVMYFAATAVGVMAFVVSRIDVTSARILAGLVAMTMVVGGSVLLRVPVYSENSGTLRFISHRELMD